MTFEKTDRDLTFSDAEAQFGPALETDEFNMEPEMPAFRISLPELFGQAAIDNGIRILEATWSHSQLQNRTLWFVGEGDRWAYGPHRIWDTAAAF
jgi:hypothetical protein